MRRVRSARATLGIRLLLLALTTSAVGCRAFPGHPVRSSEPRLDAGVARGPLPAVPEPPTPGGEDAVRALFRGLDGILEPLRSLHAEPGPAGRGPRMQRMRRMERVVKARYRRGGFGGRVRGLIALAATGRVPIAPRAMAALLLDPEVERSALSADAVRRLGVVYDVPGMRRERYRMELLRRGYGPFRFDLRFSFAFERLDVSEDVVYLRYDPDVRPRPEHVTLFRGGCLLQRDGQGTRVTEILILGTDLLLLPPLQTELLGLVEKELRDRASEVFERAWAGR